MDDTLLPYLRCPRSGAPLVLTTIEQDDQGRTRLGYLTSQPGGNIYPIIGCVPVLLREPWIDPRFAQLLGPHLPPAAFLTGGGRRDWSFDTEWEAHDEGELARTWGLTAAERVRMFFLETALAPETCRNRTILDAGSGNGHLTDALGPQAGLVIGLDYSTSPFAAERCRRSPNVYFIVGDILSLPLRDDAIDVVYSSGVLHHTGDTRAAFASVSRAVKPEGRMYVWLYRKTRHLRQRLLLEAGNNLRKVAHVLPKFMRGGLAHAWAASIYAATKVFETRRKPTYPEILISALDLLTPRHVTFHTPTEMAEWFFASGFGPASLTHWDNPNGFGMTATRHAQAETPGVNFGLPDVKRRYSL